MNGAQGDLYYCNGKVVGVKTSGMDFFVAMRDLGTMTWYDAGDNCAAYSFCGNVKGSLPAKDQLVTMYNNKSSLNSLLSTNGGTKLTENRYWSSTTSSGGYHYNVSMSHGSVYSDHGDASNNLYVRPVLVNY